MNYQQFLTADFLKVFLPLAGAAVAWFWSERRRRAWEEYQRKEDRYRELLRALRGFYVESADIAARQVFLEQLALCWLYCSDEVIRQAYQFIRAIQVGAATSQEQKQHATGAFVLAVRQDLLSRRIVRRTALTPQDFLHVTAKL